jgi:hypothetical protein
MELLKGCEDKKGLGDCLAADGTMLKLLDRDQSCVNSAMFREIAAAAGTKGRPPLTEVALGEPVNVLRNSVQITGGPDEPSSISILQAGALTDLRDTMVSLKQLAEAVGGNQDAKAAIAETREKLQAQLKHGRIPPDQARVLQHMVDELEEKNLPRALTIRREILQQQLLFIVHAQVQESAREKDTWRDLALHISHTSLLHPDTDTWESQGGLSHNEARMIEDMQQIFKEFDGRKIVFETPDSKNPETTAPYIDLEGTIHLPRPEGVDPKTQGLTLRSHYGNAAVFKEMSADAKKVQEGANEQLLKDMDEELKKYPGRSTIAVLSGLKRGGDPEKLLPEFMQAEQWERARKLFEKAKKGLREHPSYDPATELIEAQKLMGWRVSLGCFSNKDRGGVAGRKLLTEMMIHGKEALAKFYRATNAPEADLLEAQARGLSEQLYKSLDADSIQIKFANWSANTRVRTLKTWVGLKGKAATTASHVMRLFLDFIASIGPAIKKTVTRLFSARSSLPPKSQPL